MLYLCVALCGVMLRCVVVLCCVVWCGVVLRCVVLCCVVHTRKEYCTMPSFERASCGLPFNSSSFEHVRPPTSTSPLLGIGSLIGITTLMNLWQGNNDIFSAR